MPLLLHQPLLLLNASADHHLPWRRSSPISSCQGAVAELALPQPWTSSGHPSPISPRPHPLAAAPSYSWWLSLLPWMLAVLPSLVLTSAPCVGWPVAPALGLSSANSAPSIPARILLIGPAQIILMPDRGTTATAMKPHRVAPALDVFDGISQHVPTRSAALVARTSNPATVDVVPRASPMR
ncbi:40S ribosomal protein S4-3 [Zea mays]|uniref:40S ribosomal protein S4-3 n=1 Tax=Zea mays TaxID=4577 RepID=A0A1D6FQQ8_MAIZE|nr:40S ribosomal protein S4-3 [Zea mays]